jgi:D-alanine--poly(phosphoribitol) ligase subunit 2
MLTRDHVVRRILDVACEMNNTLSRPIDVAGGERAPLFGSDGVLDSLGLVSFIVAVEQALDEPPGAAVMLADERAVSQRVSPFRTVGTLADYVMAQSARPA